MGLAASEGPYFQMVGWAGSNPLIGKDLDHKRLRQQLQACVAGEAGKGFA